jgi:DNA-binding transcriptional LysR family regulator
VSKALARLEQRLGTRLINRTSRRLTLTDAGQALAERAARLLADAEAAERVLREQAGAPSGLVRIAAPMSFGIREVAPLLPDLLARYPALSIDLHLGDERVDIAGAGFDLALRIGELEDSSLIARRLAPIGTGLFASPAYLARHGRPAHPSELTAHACFTYAYQRSPHAWHLTNGANETVTLRPAGRLRVNNGEAAVPALLAGLGIAQVPAFFIRDAIADGRVEQVLPGWSVGHPSLYLIFPSAGPRPLRVTLVANHLAGALTRQPQ